MRKKKLIESLHAKKTVRIYDPIDSAF